jgi:hypothetical protein
VAGARFQPDPKATYRDLADLIQDMGDFVSAQYQNVEAQLIALVAKYARKQIETPDDVVARLAAIQRLRAEADAIAKTLNAPDLANRVVAIAASEGNAAAVARIGYLPGVKPGPIPATSAAATAQVALDLASSLDDMTKRITRYAPDAYQRVIGLLTPEVLTGTTTFTQTQRNAVQRFLGQGISGFTDKAGRDWRIGTYSEMATRTATHRAWQEANLERVRTTTGITLATIIRGVDSCAPCARWGGKIVSTDGTGAGVYHLEDSLIDGKLVDVTVSGTIEQARQDGWDHPNCRCVVSAYMPGLSLPANQESTFDPQAEKDRDRQRALERRIRDLQRKKAASVDDFQAAAAGRKVRAAQADMRQFLADTGRNRRPERERITFTDGQRAAPPLPKPQAIG